jgi:glutamyl-tRNA synthetase
VAQVDEWVAYAPAFGVGSEFEGACAYVNGYLGLRTFLVGNELSIADITVIAHLARVGPRWESLRKSTKYPNLARWYNSILAQYPAVADALPRRGGGRPGAETEKGVSKASAGEVLAEAKEKVDGSFEVDLPGAEMGKVCTRFPPEPSGYLHIGHAKAALLNQFFAQKYKGKLIIRFDDTNPAKEKDEFVESILHDLDTLGVKGDVITYTSDYFPELMLMCEKLIKEEKAYADDTEREQMQSERKAMVESKCRNQTVEENLKMWQEMVAGSEKGVKYCIRSKMDMSNPNASLRDPVYYRCNPTPHHRVGSKYKVYPTYDFACPYVDSIEGVTHALRSSEYHDRNDQYYRVLEDMQLRRVHVWDFSRLNFVYTLLSKRKLQWFVDNGRVEGWNDPRFPTVQGIIRRGLTIEALKQFILSQVWLLCS